MCRSGPNARRCPGQPTRQPRPGGPGTPQETTPKTSPDTAAPTVLSWDQVRQKYPAYAAYGMDHAVNELAHVGDGQMTTPGLRFTEQAVDLRAVRFVRYPAGDDRVRSLRRAREDGVPLPPPLLVLRAGQFLTVDGNHRLSEQEMAGATQVRALVAHSVRPEPYSGRGAPGTVAGPPRA